MHHCNVLRFGSCRWLAVDPKGLTGERGFDHANIFFNPDNQSASLPGRLAHQIRKVADAADLERSRLLAWIIAWSGFSAACSLEDHMPPTFALGIAEFAASTKLNR